MRKFHIFSSFILKIFAILFMTLDHVGIYLRMSYPYNNNVNILVTIFRSFGRLALPLFIFMIVEGVIHTRSFKKYVLKLGILAILISVVIAIVTYGNFGVDSEFLQGAGNIFLDLILVAVSCYLLKQNNQYLKILILLPIAISIISFCVKCYEHSLAGTVYWYPNFLYLQGDWFSVLLGIGFYLSYQIADKYKKMMSETKGIDPAYWEVNGNSRILVSLLQIVVLAFLRIFLYIFKYIWPSGVYWDIEIQLFAIISGAFILCYNGQRGYNAKWFQVMSYLYYPLHLGIIILLFVIIHGGA